MSAEVLAVVRGWVTKAQNDWDTVRILTTHPEAPADSVCFHCQQHVEKLLKAFLTLHGIEAPKTHSLRRLIQLAAPRCSALGALSDRADQLTEHAVKTRYYDEPREISPAEMQEMVILAKDFAAILLPQLKL